MDEIENALRAAWEAVAKLDEPTGDEAMAALRGSLATFEPPHGSIWHLGFGDESRFYWATDDDRVEAHLVDEALEECVVIEIGIASDRRDHDGVYAWRLVLGFAWDEDEEWLRDRIVEEGTGEEALSAFDPDEDLGETFEAFRELPLGGIRCEPY